MGHMALPRPSLSPGVQLRARTTPACPHGPGGDESMWERGMLLPSPLVVWEWALAGSLLSHIDA